MNDLVTSGPRDVTAPAQATSVNVLAMVMEAARDPSIDATKVEAMANLAMRMQDREREAEFNRAKIAAIMEMPSISRDGKITNRAGGVQSRYSKWEDMQPIIMPILKRHGLVITHEIGNVNGMVAVRPILSHVNGFVERGAEMLLPIDTSGSKNAPQGVGAASSYGQRFTTVKMLNIITHDTEDDDGTGLGGDPMARLTDDQRALIDAGRSAAMQGSAPYAEWFGSLPVVQKGWLTYEGHHAQNKTAADLANKH